MIIVIFSFVEHSEIQKMFWDCGRSYTVEKKILFSKSARGKVGE